MCLVASLTRLRLYLSGRTAWEEMLGSFLVQSGSMALVCWRGLSWSLKVEWPKLLPCQVTLSLVYNKYFYGRILWGCVNTLFFKQLSFSLVFACTVFFSLNYLLPWWLPSGCFLILSLIVGKKLSLPIYIKEDTCIPSLFKKKYTFTVIILILRLSSFWSVEAPFKEVSVFFKIALFEIKQDPVGPSWGETPSPTGMSPHLCRRV